jgi:hypothetical protein
VAAESAPEAEDARPMTREELLELWDEGWAGGMGWYAPWSQVLEGMTPEQAAWRPRPERHSIWQIAGHIMFWREVIVRSAAGEQVGDEERARRNFESPASVTQEAWDDLRRRFEDSHRRVRDVIENPSTDLKNFQRLAYHDSYHVGQIMYLRAMQGLSPIE